MNNIKFIRQHDSRDCGAACLCMISRYFGADYSMPYLRKITHTGQNGVTISGLVDGGKNIGLTANTYKGSLADLRNSIDEANICLPLIVHLKKGHFVILERAKKGYIYICDPAYGKYKLSWSGFAQEWSGYIIEFKVDSSFSKGNHKSNAYHLLLPLIKSNAMQLIKIWLLSGIIIGITVCSAYIFQLLIDYNGSIIELYEHNKTAVIIKFLSVLIGNSYLKLIVFLLGMLFLMALLFFARGIIVSKMSKKIDMNLIYSYIDKIFNSKLQDIYSRKVGEYIARVSDLISVRRMVTDVFVSTAIDLFMIILSVILLISIHKLLFLLALGMIILYTLIAFCLKNFFNKINNEMVVNNAEMQSYLKESIQGLDVIKTNNASDKVKYILLDKYEKYCNSVLKGNVVGSFSGSLSLLVEQSGNLLVIMIGFLLVGKNILTLGELISFYMILSCLLTPIKDLLEMQPIFQTALIALGRINDVAFMENENVIPSNASLEINNIEYKNISYAYGGKNALLKNVSFSLSKGQKIAISGPNGCGKSTLVKFLVGIGQIDTGQIYINNTSVDNFSVNILRDKISYIGQDNFFFADTIKNNLTLGNSKATDSELKHVCELVEMKEFIEKQPQKYNTYISENGNNLSYGQRQALAIARALIRKPELIILDEATSNMDYKRENIVLHNIMSLDISMIIITHNKDILNLVNHIIYL